METAAIPVTQMIACWNHRWRQCTSLYSISRVQFTLN